MKKPILHKKYRAIFLAVAEAYFPAESGLKLSGSEGINPDFVSRYFGYAEDDLRLGFKGLLFFLDSIAPFLAGKGLKKMRNLPLKERIDVLEKLENSSNYILRYLILTGKTLISMFYYDNPETWEDIGYREECLKRDGE